MHCASIETEETAPGRVYWRLRERMWEWVDHYELQVLSETTSISTHLSNVRKKLNEGGGGADGYRLETERRRRANGKMGWFSRVVLDRARVAA